MKQDKQDDGYRMSDVLWARIEPLLHAPKSHVSCCCAAKSGGAILMTAPLNSGRY